MAKGKMKTVREKEASLIPYYDGKLEYYSPAAETELTRIMNKVVAPVEGSMLDVGCGDGRASLYSKKHGMDYVGADYSQARVSKARSVYGQTVDGRRPVIFMCTNIYDLLPAIAAESYELIWCCELLEHLEQPTVIWEAMQRLCRGMVVCTCPVNMPYASHLQVFKNDEQLHATFPGITNLHHMRFPTGHGKKREHFIFTYEYNK